MSKQAICALVFGAFMLGCGNAAVGMQPVAGAADARAAEGQAVVVFVRHSRLGKKVSFPIVTEDGQFVAVLRGKMHATVVVPPGRHRFVVLAENAEVVEGQAGSGLRGEAGLEVANGRARPCAGTLHRADHHPQHCQHQRTQTPLTCSRTHHFHLEYREVGRPQGFTAPSGWPQHATRRTSRNVPGP